MHQTRFLMHVQTFLDANGHLVWNLVLILILRRLALFMRNPKNHPNLDRRSIKKLFYMLICIWSNAIVEQHSSGALCQYSAVL